MAKNNAKKADPPAVEKADEKPVDVVTGKTVELPEEAVEAAPEATKAEPVTLSRWGLEVEHNTLHRVNVKPEVTPEQCMDEGFWTHISMRFAPGDTIIVRPEHNEWELVLHVINAGTGFAHVLQKHYYNLAPVTELQPVPSLYKIEFAGNVHKWRFLREGKMMRDGFATRELAARAAHNHQMAVDR